MTARRPTLGTSDRALVAMTGMVFLGALYGGASLLAWPRDGGPLHMPPEWMTRTAFGSYRVPGLILLLVVGGSSGASLVAVLRRWVSARALNLLAASILVGWMLTQVALLGLVHPFQPIFGAVGVAIFAVALRAGVSTG